MRVRAVVAGGIGLRVTGAEPGIVETALATDPTVTDHERIAAGEDRSLYYVGFAGAFDGLFEAVADRGGTVLGTTGGRPPGRFASGSPAERASAGSTPG